MADSVNTLKGTLGGRKVSARAYAAHRGIDPMAVSRAIKRGRLNKSVIGNGDGTYTIDVDLADREWAENTDLTRAPFEQRDQAPPPPQVASPEPVESTVTAAARSKHWEAKHRELKFKEAARELVPAAEMKEALTKVFANCRTRLLALPTRARQALPHLSLADVAAFEALVREALEDLAEGPELL